MYDRSFFGTRLGQAALVSIAAMIVFAMASGHVEPRVPGPSVAAFEQVELA